jgi:hypothetical protein
LHDGQERIGLVIADKEWTERHIGMKDLHYLQMFCKETAHVIGSYRQQQRIPEINKASALNDIKTDPNFANLQELEVVQGIVLSIKKGLETRQ